MKFPDGIVDVLQLGVALHIDVLIDMYFDAGRAQGKQAFLRAAEVS